MSDPINPTQSSPATANFSDPNEQWLDSKLVARSELKFDQRKQGGATHVVIEDPARGKFFQVGVEEYHLIASLDGQKTLREVVADICQLAASMELELDEERAIKICQWLVNNNLVYGPEVDSSKRLDMQAKMAQRAKLMGWLNPISCKFKLFNPNRMLSRIQTYTQWLFSGWVFVIWLLVGAYAVGILYNDWDQLGKASAGIFAGSKWIWLLLIWIGLKVIHEAAHGIACRRFGGEVPEAGVLLLLFTPLAYVNVTSMWRFPNRWHRIVVAAAGMYVEIFISFLSIILWQRYPGVVGNIAFDVFIMSSVTTILFNANPLMRFDGYFILSDLLKVPNLYPKGTKWFGDRLKSLYFGIPKTENICAAHELRSVAIYGSMAFIWKILICFSLIIAASVLFYGAGIALAAVAVVLWFGLPIFNQFRSLFGSKALHKVDNKRMALSISLTLLMAGSLFWVLKAPASKSAPAVVQFSDEQIVRAKADGFVQEILVRNGQAVRENDALMVLVNPQLVLEMDETEKLAEEANIQTRIHMQADETALAQASMEKYQGLLEQLAEKREQVEGLTLRAPFDGYVHQRNLSDHIDSFARRGDPLLSVAQAETKEVVVSIDQRDLELIKENEGKRLRIAFPGMPVFSSTLVHIDPRASVKPQHPSLCASVGGPLPVKPSMEQADEDDPKFELLVPRFNVELELESEVGAQLHSGQRGRAFFATNRQSLGSYLFVAVSDWFEQKIELATQTAVF